jgi:transcriptional regulator with XRE-family HTH domain
MDKVNARMRELRTARRVTLQRLSEMTGFSKGYLSRIERADAAPRLPTIQRIARALDVGMESILEGIDGGKGNTRTIDFVAHAGTGAAAEVRSDSGYSFRSLVHHFRGKYMVPCLMKISPGRTDNFSHDSEEFIFVLHGTVLLSVDGNKQLLQAGDSAYFDSRLSHRLSNDGEEDAKILNVVFDYKRF